MTISTLITGIKNSIMKIFQNTNKYDYPDPKSENVDFVIDNLIDHFSSDNDDYNDNSDDND